MNKIALCHFLKLSPIYQKKTSGFYTDSRFVQALLAQLLQIDVFHHVYTKVAQTVRQSVDPEIPKANALVPQAVAQVQKTQRKHLLTRAIIANDFIETTNT